MVLLSIQNLTAGYGKIAIVQDVSLDVEQGEIFAVAGPNGSGKSTLFKAIFGLAKIMSGRVLFSGRDLTGMKGYLLLRAGLGYMMQLQNVFTSMTIEENLELNYIDQGLTYREMLERIYSLFPFLRERASEKAGVLSGGQRQLLALAKTLMGNPKLVILDEPTAGLSPKASNTVLLHVENLKQNGITVVIIEHNLKKVFKIADKVCVLASGKKVFEGKPENLEQNRELAKIYLGLKTSETE
ncbi:MAG: ABC transporter ATP-binding protein [Candidatus Caldarchaeum sp.]|nr:ABC transporter ATP-binding protein [Candidatus Caldarchaeum sp.]